MRPSLERLLHATVVEVVYPAHRGTIGMRGSHDPLSWEETTAPALRDGDRHVFELQVPHGDLVELKLVRNDEAWASGRNYTVHAGDHLRIEPYFDRDAPVLLERDEVDADGVKLAYEVLLPPSYDEQETKRYPVVYAQDGQALWSTSQDPYGVWGLDTTLARLFELGAVEEMIVVGIDTSARRIERLSPGPDPRHGGGEGPAHLAGIVDALIPKIHSRFRTKSGREDTAALGSSMGGLFSFYAAWTRPDVFGKAACLSSSFWWAQRDLVRVVQTGPSPTPRPLLYLDSGASASAFENDPGARDGFHHTRSMFRALLRHGYVPGQDLHRLTFVGHTHDAAAWGARISIPLELLFPPPPTAALPAGVFELRGTSDV